MPHPSPEKLALAALPAEPVEPEVAAHLHTCRTCRGKVASLRHTVDTARDSTTDPATDPEPPPRVWHAITAELDDELDVSDAFDAGWAGDQRRPNSIFGDG